MIKPLNDKVLIKRSEAETVSAGGIVIPKDAIEQATQGTVLSVGSNVKEVKEGDVVLFKKYSGIDVKINNSDMLVLPEEDILGIME